jgi:uncharacterized protein (TIGR02186 family)
MRRVSGNSCLIACALAAALSAPSIVPARAERLVASLSNHVVQITSSFTGVELVLFGTVEGDQETAARNSPYDIVATVIGPRQTMVTRRKERMFGIWVNAGSRSFIDVPSYLQVLATRPFAEIANAETLRRQQVGIADTLLPEQAGEGISDAVAKDTFRQAFVRIKSDRGLYGETTNGVTFLTPTLYRASILVPAEAPVGNYEVDVKLFADGAMIARANSAFEIVTVGFERFIASAAVDHGLFYGLATAMMALMTGWLASIVFRRD